MVWFVKLSFIFGYIISMVKFFISKQNTKITLNYITSIKHDRNVKLKMNNINLKFTSKDQLEI